MPSFEYEDRCEGIVAGIDEAGRGPLAGPVVAAAVVIDRALLKRGVLKRIDDSKKLTPAQREAAFAAMRDSGAVRYAIGVAEVEEIDRINILQATFLAMRRALETLDPSPVVALVDGNQRPAVRCRTEMVIGGDAASYSIAAASIVAKVTRDRLMSELARTFPVYGWDTNRGYGSAAHLAALAAHGPTPHHRKSFAPVGRLL